MRTRTKKPLTGTLAGLETSARFEDLPKTGTHCSVCGTPQRESSAGVTCANGHGGAPAYEDERPSSPRTVASIVHQTSVPPRPEKTGVVVHAAIDRDGEITQFDPPVDSSEVDSTVKRATRTRKPKPVSVVVEPGITTTIIDPSATMSDPADVPREPIPTGGNRHAACGGDGAGDAPHLACDACGGTGKQRRTVWTEDDATPYTPGHETIDAAWLRLYGEVLDTINAVRVEDLGECTDYYMPGGRIARVSMPGYSIIEELVGGADSEHVSQAELAKAIDGVKAAASRVRRPIGLGPDADGTTLRFVPVSTRELVEVKTIDALGALLRGPSLGGAIVKVAVEIAASCRDGFDGAGVKAKLIEHGASAVMLAPRIVSDGAVSATAKRAAAVAATPEDAVREWFAGQTGLTDDEREAAVDLALEIIGAS